MGGDDLGGENSPHSSLLDIGPKSASADASSMEHQTEHMPYVTVEDDGGLKPPDGGWGWVIVVASAVSHMIIGGVERSGGVLYLVLLERYQSSSTVTAWVTSLSSGLRLVMGPFTSALSRKFGFRPVVFVGAIITTVGCVLSAFPHQLFYVHLSFGVLGGIGRGLCYTPSVVIVGVYFDKKRGIAVGLATAGVGMGSLFLPPLLEYLFENMAYQGTFIILGGVTLQLCICAMLFTSPVKAKHKKVKPVDCEREYDIDGVDDYTASIRDVSSKPAPENDASYVKGSAQYSTVKTASENNSGLISPFLKRDNDEDDCVVSGRDEIKKLTTVKKSKKTGRFFGLGLLKDPLFLAFCVTVGLVTMAFQIVLAFLPALAESKGLSNIQSVLLLSVMGVIDTVARIACGIVFDLKRVRPYRRYLYNASLLLIALITLLSPLAESFPAFVLISAGFGLLGGAYISQKSVIIVDLLGKEALVPSFGMVAWFQGIGTFIGPPIAGQFRDSYKNYDLAFLFGGGITLLASLLLLVSNLYFYCRNRNGPESLVREQTLS